IGRLLRQLQGSKHEPAPGEDDLDVSAVKPRTNPSAGVLDKPPVDKTQPAESAQRRSSSQRMNKQRKFLALDDLELSSRLKEAGDRHDRPGRVVEPARQQHR